MQVISKNIELFLILISPEKRETFLYIGEEQSLSYLPEEFDVCHFENGNIISNLSKGKDFYHYDLIFCPNPTFNNFINLLGLSKTVDRLFDMLDEEGKLVIGFKGQKILSLVRLAALKRLISWTQKKSMHIHIAYPSVENPERTCLWEKESICYFYENLYGNFYNVIKNIIYNNLKRAKILPYLANSYIIEIKNIR